MYKYIINILIYIEKNQFLIIIIIIILYIQLAMDLVLNVNNFIDLIICK